MSTELRERLGELAQQARTTPSAPTDLWQRGRRWHRRRAGGLAAVAAVTITALSVVGGVSWQRAEAPAPASTDGQPVMPDRIYEPSPWLPGTADAGPPGQLVAVFTAFRRSWTGMTMGMVGVSAGTGEYRFLDLPGLVMDDLGEGAALSPDGRRIAYWVTGETSGRPNRLWGRKPVVGVGVYDTRTGEVSRDLMDTAHGLSPNTLVWADEDTVLVGFSQFADARGGYSTGAPMRSWNVTGNGSDVLDLTGRGIGDPAGPGSQGVVPFRGRSGLWLIDVPEQGSPRRFALRGRTIGQYFLSPSGDRLASLWAGGRRGESTRTDRLMAGVVPEFTGITDGPAPEVAMTLVPGDVTSHEVLGWVDDDHVAVLGPGPRMSGMVRSVNVDTGAAKELVVLESGTWSGLQFASGLLGSPVVEAPAPQRPMDPRLVAGLGGGIVVAALVGGLLWTRRVRP